MILTIDQGTTSSRALLLSAEGKIIDIAQKEFKQVYPQPGWVEHDPLEIWQTTLDVCTEIIKKHPQEINGIAITNQRETTILWNKKTGKPVANAIVWQCRRTAEHCQELRADAKFNEHVRRTTGLLIDSYFSGPKIAWLLKAHPELDPNDILFGTVDTWILWNLTKGVSHFTEASNASRTMLFDINKGTWDDKILKKLNIPHEILPQVKASQDNFGQTDLFKDICSREIPIKAILGDQQAAWYAHKESAKITYGTGSFILLPASKQNPLVDGLVTSVGYKKNEENVLALEGSIFIAGAAVQWLRDELKLIKSSSEVEALAKTVDDNGGVYFVPALTGLGAPYWKEEARGAIFGLTRASNRGHFARAALEGIAYSVKDVFSRIKEEFEFINVDGGASKNDLLMQFQADLLGVPLRRYSEVEMTALGAARMTGDIELDLAIDKIFEPQKDLSENYDLWLSYITKVF